MTVSKQKSGAMPRCCSPDADCFARTYTGRCAALAVADYGDSCPFCKPRAAWERELDEAILRLERLERLDLLAKYGLIRGMDPREHFLGIKKPGRKEQSHDGQEGSPRRNRANAVRCAVIVTLGQRPGTVSD